jgi:DNA-binding GntR family transcriptional regulator
MDAYTLDKLSEHKPIRDEVFNTLRDAILNGHFGPGERLVEQDIAQQLQISRTPIREALRKLELEGLVAYEPRKGVVVVGVSSEDAIEIYTIRAVLEGLAAKLAAHTRTEGELQRLQELLDGMEACIQQDNITKLTALHASFHTGIAEASKSRRLYQMLISLREYVKNFAEIPCYLPGRLHLGWAEHKEIVDAIAARDEQRAEDAARKHIVQARESLLTVISKNEEHALMW